jgi:chromatin structure-remodeling complex subunit RSC1/2
MYNPPRVVETYVLGEVANASMPADIRAQFHRDDLDRVLFFTNPPLNATRDIDDRAPVKHSLRYLACRARRKDDLQRKREIHASESQNQPVEVSKRAKTEYNPLSSTVQEGSLTALADWSIALDSSTDELYKKLYGSDWRQSRHRGKSMTYINLSHVILTTLAKDGCRTANCRPVPWLIPAS